MRFFILILLFSASFFPVLSQDLGANIQTIGLGGIGTHLPFWMTHNQLGKYSATANHQELTELILSGRNSLPGNLSLSYGTDLALLLSEEGTTPKIIQAYLGLSGKVIRLQAGAFADDELCGGLSSSNTDLLRSLNYRPYPKVRLSTPGFIPFLFAKNWFRFSAEYDEGILPDERVAKHPHLHHKSLMLQFHPSSSLRFTVGLNHTVFWGGNSESLGQLPDMTKDYVRYVTGAAGGSDFQKMERHNVAGNQLGSYHISLEKDFEKYFVQIHVSHPFEDGSGMGFENLKDNLYTFHWQKNKSGTLLDEFLIEFLYSKHQSGDQRLEIEAGKPKYHLRGGDDYFNHSIYQTGYTYKGYSMGTPMFEPLRFRNDGKIVGVANNRVSAFHAGAKGILSKTLSWKTMVTYSRNFGTYFYPMNSMREQFASYAELSWKRQSHPLTLSALVGFDYGELTSNTLGAGLMLNWIIR